MMFNIFTKKEVPDVFQTLNYTETITLTSIDPPYFAVRNVNDLLGARLGGAPFPNIFDDIQVGEWAIVEQSSPPILNELQFLSDMALAVKKEGNYYVYQLAEVLYDKQNGLFSIYNDADTAIQKKEKMNSLIQIFLSYILPGRWWRTYYAQKGLSKELYDARILAHELLEIEKWIADLNAEYGYNIQRRTHEHLVEGQILGHLSTRLFHSGKPRDV